MDRTQILDWARYYEEKRHTITKGLVAAVIEQESGFNPLAGGKAGEIGLMQIIPKYALADYNQNSGEPKVEPFQLAIVEPNIRVGTWYLLEWIPKLLADAKVSPTVERVLAAYNAGPSVSISRSWPFSTEGYIDNIVRISGYARSTPVKPSKTTIFYLAAAVAGMVAAYKSL